MIIVLGPGVFHVVAEHGRKDALEWLTRVDTPLFNKVTCNARYNIVICIFCRYKAATLNRDDTCNALRVQAAI